MFSTFSESVNNDFARHLMVRCESPESGKMENIPLFFRTVFLSVVTGDYEN